MFNNYALTSENKMDYNKEKGIYEKAIIIKQGFTNYEYTIADSNGKVDYEKAIDGNFIQTENILLVPKFGIEEDNQALEQIKSCFPEYAKKNRIVQINCSEIIKGGGALNCISWNVYKSKNIPHPTTLYFINDVLKNIDKNNSE